MKRITSIIRKSLTVILISGGLLAASAQAQDRLELTATVPFAFSADSQTMAAGTYSFGLLSQWLLSIRNTGTNKVQIFMLHPEEGGPFESHRYLTFRRYEGRYYLAVVHISDANVDSELVQKYPPVNNETKAGASGN